MTAQEELSRRISRDGICRAVQKKIDEGKADFSDTARYNDRAAELLGEVLAAYVPDMPPDERETLCKGLLRQRYTDTNAMLNAVQRALDAAQGLHLAPQIADYPEERVDQAAHALADETVPVETIVRRAKSAPATIARSFHDDYIEKNAAFRDSAGLKCYITRIAAGGCCKWCTAMAGRYRYGEEPEDVYRRHDNCSCTVTYENGRQRQDVWSKRTWEAPASDAGAGDPVVFDDEHAQALQDEKGLTILPQGAIMETERSMHFRDFRSASAYMEKKYDLSISGLEGMPLENLKAVSDCIHRMYRAIPQLDGFIDRIVLADMNDIAKATVRWHGDEPEILLKLSRNYFTSMSITEIEDAIQLACENNIFSLKSGLDGIFKHESVHFAEYFMTFKKYGRNSDARASLDRYELASQIVDLAFAECGIERTAKIISLYISDYATENAAELIAEAYSSENNNLLVDAIKHILMKKWGL